MIKCTHWAVLEPFCENFGPNGHTSWAPQIGKIEFWGPGNQSGPLPECFGATKNCGKMAFLGHFWAFLWVFWGQSTPLVPPKPVKIGFWRPGNHPGPLPGCFGAKKKSRKNRVFGPFLDPFWAPPWAFWAQMAPFGGPNMAHMAVLRPQTCLEPLKKCFWAPQNFLKNFGFRLENGPRPRPAGPAARGPAPALPGLRRGP